MPLRGFVNGEFADRGLRADRRLRDGGAGRAQRLDRLAVPAAVRLAGLLCRAARRARARPLADRPRRPGSPRSSAATVDGSLVLATTFETAEGAVELIDFFRPRHGPLDLVRLVRGLRGRVAMRVEFILRFDYGSLVPWVERLSDGGISAIARAGPGGAAHAGAAARRGPEDGRRVRGRRRRDDPVRADLRPVAPAAAAADRPRAGAAQCARLLAAVVATQCAPAGPWTDTVKRSLVGLERR